MGGFVSVVCSLLTGQTNIAWKIILRGNAISTGSSSCVVHSVRFSLTMDANLRRVGNAMAPAVAAIYSGDSAERPRREQNSRVKDPETSSHAVSVSKVR